MKTMRPISILLSFVMLAGVEAAFARDGGAFASRHSGRAGGGLMGARPGAVARPATGIAPGYQGVRPAGRHGWQGVRPIVSVHPQPGVVIRHHHHPSRTRFIFGSTVILGAPFFYPPPVYIAPAPVYTEPPVYIEQSSQVYYYCPDYRDYYPNVATCPSPWLQVLPEAVNPN